MSLWLPFQLTLGWPELGEPSAQVAGAQKVSPVGSEAGCRDRISWHGLVFPIDLGLLSPAVLCGWQRLTRVQGCPGSPLP